MSDATTDSDLRFTPQNAVRWLSPRELTSAAIRVGLSTAFGEYADKRELEAQYDPSLHEDLESSDEVWLDYISDVGDGFDPTYTIAELAAREQLDLADEVTLPRAAAVVLGGDQVYPTANRDQYRNRMTGPYRAAIEGSSQPGPQMFAIPGNHDWYDGLTSFIRIFCDRTTLGEWQLPQHRSYFAIALTEHWWLWAVDIQFDGYIDTPQIDFFADVAAQKVAPGAGIILCSAKPAWARAAHDGGERPSPSMRNLDFFVDRCVPDGASVRMHLSGDWHHYGRYEAANGAAYVTSGGGGAYLSATHHLADEVKLRRSDQDADVDLQLRATYPGRDHSRRRRWTGPLVGWKNPSFAVLVGLVYLLLGTISISSRQTVRFTDRLRALGDAGVDDSFRAAMRGLFTSGGGIVMILLFGAALIGLAAPGKLRQPWRGHLAGVGHTVAHVIGFGICVCLGTLAVSLLGDDPNSAIAWVVWILTMTISGAVLGSIIFGTYLALADTIGVNTNELFAGQRFEDSKQFLRIRVTPDAITAYVVAVDRCPHWEIDPDRQPGGAMFRHRSDADGRGETATEARLVETFTVRREPST